MTDVDPLLGRTLAGRYRLLSRLGHGGMSSVYLSRHALIDRLSAIKVLHERLSVHPEHKERFLREARAVNRINHPNIVEISDYGETEITFDRARNDRRVIVYLVMEYVPGETLAKMLLRGALPETRLVPIALQVASALARAHQTGVIHRDVKPENVLLVSRRGWSDLVKLTDFGVAKMTQLPRGEAGNDQVVGTPGFIAPEYLVGEPSIDGRADLYSLGVVMYEALTGALPYDAQTESDLLTMPITDEAIPLRRRRANIAPQLEEVVMRCLRRRADERPRDAFALIDELRAACPWTKNIVDPTMNDGRSPPRNGSSERLAAVSADVTSHEPRTSTRMIAGVSPPRWGDVPPAQIAEAWRTYHKALDHLEAGKPNEPPPEIAQAINRRGEILAALDAASDRVVVNQHELETLANRGRDFRATLGRAIDTLAHDLSRAHARTVELKQRRVELHLRRRNSPDPGAADALLWEEAAVDDELRKAHAAAADLGYQVGTLQDELFRRNDRHEAEVHRTTGTVEGEVAAMSTLHRELELITTELCAYLRVA